MEKNKKSSRYDTGPQDFSRFSSYNKRPFNNSSPREMHKTKCADCGKSCEVPFKPKEGRPVYCRECFAKNKPKRF